MIVHAGIEAGLAVIAKGIGGHGQHGGVGVLGQAAQGTGGRQTVELRHLHVHQDQVVEVLPGQRQRLQPIASHMHLHTGCAQQLGGHSLIDQVVLGQQHPGARQALLHGRQRVRRRLPGGLGQRAVLAHRPIGMRQPGREPETAALPQHAVHPNLAAHQLSQVPGDGQAQAGATKAPGAGVVGLFKGVKQAVQLVWRHTHARIGDRELQQQWVGRLRRAVGGLLHRHARPGDVKCLGVLQLAAQHDVTPVAELDGVAHQVEHRLRQAGGVAAQQRRHAVGLHHHGQALAAGLFSHQCAGACQQRMEVEVVVRQLQLARFDLAEIEHVVDHRQQVVRGVRHLAQAVGGHRLGPVSLHQIGQADDGVHRGADLVTHVGQKSTLGAVGGLGPVAGDGQLVVQGLQLELGLFEARDVGHQHDQSGHPIALKIRHVLHPDMAQRAVRSGQSVLKVKGSAPQRVGKCEFTRIVVRVANDLTAGQPHQLAAPAKPVDVGTVGKPQHPVGAPVAHHVGQVVGDRVQKVFTLGTGCHRQTQRVGACLDLVLQMQAVSAELGLGALALGDVAADKKPDGALLQPQAADTGLDLDHAAVTARHQEFANFGGGVGSGQPGQHLLAGAVCVPVPGVHLPHGLDAVTQHVGKRGIDLVDRAIGVEHHHPIARLLDHHPAPAGVVPQALLDLALPADVDQRAHQAQRAAVVGTLQYRPLAHPALAPVITEEPQLNLEDAAGLKRFVMRRQQASAVVAVDKGQHLGHAADDVVLPRRVATQTACSVSGPVDALGDEIPFPDAHLAGHQRHTQPALALLQGCGGAALPADVSHRAHQPLRFAGSVVLQQPGARQPALDAVAANKTKLQRQWQVLCQGAAHRFFHSDAVIGMQVPEQLDATQQGRVDQAGGNAQDGPDLGRQVKPAAGQVPMPNAHAGRGQCQAQALLAVAQGLTSGMLVADVAAGTKDQVATVQWDAVEMGFDLPHAAVAVLPTRVKAGESRLVARQHLQRAVLRKVQVPVPHPARQGLWQRQAEQGRKTGIGLQHTALVVQRVHRVMGLLIQNAPPGLVQRWVAGAGCDGQPSRAQGFGHAAAQGSGVVGKVIGRLMRGLVGIALCYHLKLGNTIGKRIHHRRIEMPPAFGQDHAAGQFKWKGRLVDPA